MVDTRCGDEVRTIVHLQSHDWSCVGYKSQIRGRLMKARLLVAQQLAVDAWRLGPRFGVNGVKEWGGSKKARLTA